MKITYKIKFTVQQSAKLFLRNVEGVIIDSLFGNLLARLYDQRYTNFISDQDVKTAVKALITDGETLTITDEKFGGIPYILNDSMDVAFVRPGGREPIVNAEVELAEFDKDGRPMVLVANKRPILFVNRPTSTSKLMYSVAELRGAVNPVDKIQTVDIYTQSHSDVLARFFIKLLGTAYYGNMSPDARAMSDAVKPNESNDTQTSIPNHLLHGHDGDPVIHPPVARKAAEPEPTDEDPFADLYSEEDVMEAPNYVNPMKDVKFTEPAPTQAKYPVKHEQVYRTAALALSKLDLTAVIKAQRVIFPESEYWKEITRAKLYEVLMEELMKTCDWEVGMIDQGNGPFLDNHPRMLCADIEKYPFIINTHLSTEPGSGSSKHKYQYTIAYRPIGVTAEAEVQQ
ncbi:MAG: hypothetical protein IKA48_02655 [Fibrobacter sp.]|nr:hypothetical protein [Fibrobacter sp.]